MTGPDNLLTIGQKPSLSDQFNTARYGHYFRTATFLNTTTNNREWLYAVQDPQARRCILMKVRENETGEERVKIKDNMAFLDALNHMSRFEHPDANPNFVPANTDEKNALGKSHFQNFALNEGLIRDIHTGEFHPTLYGHVVTSGSFDPHEVARIQMIANAPQKTPESFIIPGHDAIVRAGESSIDVIARMHTGIAKITAVLSYHRNLLALTQNYDQSTDIEGAPKEEVRMHTWQYNLDFSTETDRKALESAIKKFNAQGIGKKLSRSLSITDDGTRSFQGYLHDFYIQKLKSLSPEQKEDGPEFQRILKLHELVFEHSRCRNTYQQTLRYHSDNVVREARVDNHQSSMKRLQKICQKLDFDDVQTGTVKAFVFSQETLPYHDQIQEFLWSLRMVKTIRENNIENEKRNLSALVPKNSAASFKNGLHKNL